jgi:hypothetical protein
MGAAAVGAGACIAGAQAVAIAVERTATRLARFRDIVPDRSEEVLQCKGSAF